MINTKLIKLQIFGCLMKNPLFLSQTDKYNLNLTDFSTRFERYIFDAINSIYFNGAKKVGAIEIENYLSSNAVAEKVFADNNGQDYLKDAEEFAEVGNFDYWYNSLKKYNALTELKKKGFDIKRFYNDDLTDVNAIETNIKYEDLTIQDIFDSVRRDIVGLEREYVKGDITETQDVFEGLEHLLGTFETHENIGLPLQGKIFNDVMTGARLGTLCLRSGGSGLGKTRNMVADACFMAFPLRFNSNSGEWEQKGNNEKVLYVVSEQTVEEIQSMVLAYITDINESKFDAGALSEFERHIVDQGIEVIKKYRDNFQIIKMPSPTTESVKAIVREECLIHDIRYLFFDYIFVSPALVNEFSGMRLRNDEALLFLTTVLKDLATELNIFVMSGTQVNANADDNKEIRNEASLAGGRSTINKADYGFIMARPTKEELEVLKTISTELGKEPNIVTDVYKVRKGRWTQVRIWSFFHYGTMRREDLFMTDSKMDTIDMSDSYSFEYESWEDNKIGYAKQLTDKFMEEMLGWNI